MSVADLRHYQTSPVHLGKLHQARFSSSQDTLVKTFIAAMVVGAALLYLASFVTAVLSGMTDVVYLQGGGIWENIPLILFSLIMALGFIPLAVLLLFSAGAFVLVPPINWCVRRVSVSLRRKFGGRAGQTGQLYKFRRVSS